MLAKVLLLLLVEVMSPNFGVVCSGLVPNGGDGV